MPCDGHQEVDVAYMKWQLLHQRPGDITRQHITACMIDPLRNLRFSKNEVAVHIHFPGYRLAAYKHLPALFLQGLHSDNQTVDFGRLTIYTQAHDQVTKFLRPMFQNWYGSHLDKIGDKIREARIRADVRQVTTLHHRFVREALAALRWKSSNRYVPLEVKKPVTDEQYVETRRLLARLAAALPQKLENSDFGVVHVESAFAEWKRQQKDRARAKKRKAREHRIADQKRLKGSDDLARDETEGLSESDHGGFGSDYYSNEYGYGGDSDGGDDSEEDAESDGWEGLTWG